MTIVLTNHNNKLASDVFIQISAFKKTIEIPVLTTIIDKDTRKEHSFELIERIDGFTPDDTPLMFCLLCFNCSRSELIKYIPNAESNTPLVINIFRRVKP